MQSRLKRHRQIMGKTPLDKRVYAKPSVDRPTVGIPEQIPLLEDVVFNTQQKSHRAPQGQHSATLGNARPRSTDLFPQIMVLNGAFESAKQQADIEQLADQLVSTHSADVIRKLRDELSLLLGDIKDSAPE
jgi:hypothetical protein